MKKMIILMYDDLNQLIKKGEVVERYYNPKNYFKKIDFYLINQKKPTISNLKKMTGSAIVSIHNIKLTFLQKVLLFLNLSFLSNHLAKVVNNIKNKKPDLIRCYNLNFQIFIAQILNNKFNIPYIISLHYDIVNHLKNKNFLISSILKKRLISVLSRAYRILPVYKSAARFMIDNNLKNFTVCYNFTKKIKNKKKTIKKDKHIHFVCTNRQFHYKNPINIIKAIKEIEDARLTLIGDGPLNHYLQNYVKLNRLSSRIFFIKKIDNSEYIKILKKFDVFVNCSEINEFSKGMIEAISFGLPIISNHQSIKIPELSRNFCLLNFNTPRGYKSSMLKIKTNHLLMKKLCKHAKKVYLKNYETNNCEKKFEKIYDTLLNKESVNARY